MAGKRATIVWFDEAARRFNVKPDTLREWIAEGRFPAPRGDGNRLYYTEAELQAMVEHDFLGRWKPSALRESAPGNSRKQQGRGGKEQDSEGSAGSG